jgi:gamma-glutamylputrescine oxidase
MRLVNPRDRYLTDGLCLYRDLAPPAPRFGLLETDESVDVCVIGAGFTGLMTARHLAEKGYSVIVLERHRIGWGASGRNGGHILPGFNKDIRWLANRYGMDIATGAYAATLAARDEIKNNIISYNINAQFTPGNAIAATSKNSAADLDDYTNFLAKHCNHNLKYLNAAETESALGTAYYRGCTVDMDSGCFNPYNYLLGMAQAIAAKGVKIYEESPAAAVNVVDANTVRVTSTRHTVTAKKVVLAGDAYQGFLVPELRRKYVLSRTSMLATTVLEPEIAAKIIPAQYAVFEWRILLNYFSKTVDNRLIFGGGDSPLTNSEAERNAAFRKIHSDMIKLYPALADVHISHWWGGYLSVTYDEVPNIGKIGDNLYYSHGYSGHGVVPSHMAGRCIAEAIHGDARVLNIVNKFHGKDLPGAGHYDAWLARMGLMWYRIKDVFS